MSAICSTSSKRGAKTQTVVTIAGPDPVLLLAPNGKRIEAFFYNAGAGNVYIGPQQANGAALNQNTGIPVVTTGNFSDTSSYDAWYGYTIPPATYNVVVLEVEE